MIKQVLLNIKRYSSVSLDMVVLITLFLFILGCLLLSKNNFDKFSYTVKDKLQIVVFLKNNVSTSAGNIEKLKSKILSSNSDNIASIKNIKNIKSIDFVDKNRALKSFVAENKDLKEQLDMLEENPLKNHFVIKLKDNRYKVIKQFVDSLSSLNFIDDVVYSEDLVKNVDNFFKYMVRIGIILFTFFLGIIIWILNYTIKIDLHYKKLEFLLWRYLGAESYIENFLIFGEALILGIIAGIISIGLLFLFYWFISMFLFNIEFLSPVSIVTIFIFGIILSGAINFVVYKKSKNEIF